MALLSPADQDTLRTRFAEALEGDVRLVLFVEPPTGLYIPGRQESQTGRTAQQLVEEVAALSPRLHVEVHNLRSEPELAQSYAVDRSPALILLPAEQSGSIGSVSPAGAGDTGDTGDIAPAEAPATEAPAGAQAASDGDPQRAGPARTGAIRFFGLPAGYEFMALVEDLVDLSTGRTRLADATRQAIADVGARVHLQVFVTPT